ncbi:MAG: hypothetical protein ACPGSC_13845, partial [Granulosicoccaceae bacterium]
MSHPLIERLHHEFHYPVLRAEELEPWLQGNEHSALFMPGEVEPMTSTRCSCKRDALATTASSAAPPNSKSWKTSSTV